MEWGHKGWHIFYITRLCLTKETLTGIEKNGSRFSQGKTYALAPAGIFQGGSDVHQGRACMGVAAWGVPGGGGGAPGSWKSFYKIGKKSMKKLQFLKKLQENFAIFLNNF